MANDKDFILKNAVEVGGPTNVTLGTVTSDNIDLSTGNYFKDTPTGTSTYTISNAGDVQSFQLEVTGGTAEVAQNFSTTLYTGNGGAQTITNDIDLSTDGGLVWVKQRDASFNNILTDTERGVSKFLYSDQTNAEETYSGYGVTAFNSDGFDVTDTTVYGVNKSAATYVSWAFKKAAGFFDIVTYTGDGVAGREIAHNLGAEVGTMIIKSTSLSNSNWVVYHRSNANTEFMYLNGTVAKSSALDWFNSTTPTTTAFTVNNYTKINGSGENFVAYLFAHDTADDSLIKCGSFVNDAGSVGVEVNLGWEPQWLLIKGASSDSGLGHWYIYDNARTGNILSPNQSAAESADTSFELTSNGFTPTTNFGGTLIYIAIRAASEPAITWPSSIEWAGGIAPSAPAVGETDLFTITTDDGGTTYTGVKTADNLS